jgi:hypothetical protein
VKISRWFLARSARNSDFLKIKNKKKSMRSEKWMWALMINRDIFVHGLNMFIVSMRTLNNKG